MDQNNSDVKKSAVYDSAEGVEQVEEVSMGIFEKYLTFWIVLFMIIGILIGQFFPFVSESLAGFQFAGFSVPIAICLFFMMYPTLINIEISELKNVVNEPKPLIITLVANWVINPILGYFLAHAFFQVNPFDPFSPNQQYIVGLLLLSASPCTAMVLFWNKFGKGDIHQGLINTSLNSILILFLYSPLASLLIGLSGIQVPFEPLLFGTIFFLAIPLVLGIITKKIIYNRKGQEYYRNTFKPFLDKTAIIALLITLIVLFSLQGEVIINRPLDALAITVPLVIGYVIMFSLVFFISWILKLTYEQSVTSTVIGSSAHFEIAIATAIALFGVGSSAAFATVIGPLWEVPLMVTFITLAWKFKSRFPRK
ncbi:MAG: ACR3 family arsenite efflux transporter [Candidatus Helarchaeota archaeon]